MLGEVERTGVLPGGHHFYITFKTRLPGVAIPKHLAERFPDEMTIVIQHRFWDLKVEDDGFWVGLSFGGVPSTLRVPFAAVTDFHRSGGRFLAEVPRRTRAEDARRARGGGERRSAGESEAGRGADDGSNVVSVDFTRKK